MKVRGNSDIEMNLKRDESTSRGFLQGCFAAVYRTESSTRQREKSGAEMSEETKKQGDLGLVEKVLH